MCVPQMLLQHSNLKGSSKLDSNRSAMVLHDTMSLVIGHWVKIDYNFPFWMTEQQSQEKAFFDELLKCLSAQQ